MTVRIGNSSSGIMEAASFRIPAVNNGIRQARLSMARTSSMLAEDAAAIRTAVTQALDPAFRGVHCRGMPKPLRAMAGGGEDCRSTAFVTLGESCS